MAVLLTAAVSDRAQQAPAKPAAPAQSAPPPQAPPPVAPQQGQQGEKAATPQTPHIVQVVNLVDVLFTVLNRRNKLVPDLQKEDFQVYDEKFPQDIRYFSKQTDLPLRIGMLVDTSNSIRDRIKFEQDASINFLFSVLRRGRDEAFVMTFDDEPPVDQPDVVRRVMILISDGDDNLSTHTRGEAIEMAQRTSVVIYTISTSTQWIQLSQTDPDKLASRKTHLTEGDKILQDLADETGGRAFFPYHVDDLDQSFQDIGDELRNQYSIAYMPTNYVLDGRYHRIRIEVPDHKGYQVNARRGYFARANREGAAQPTPSGSGPGTP
jgi:Ca-activated chloride channel homolog